MYTNALIGPETYAFYDSEGASVLQLKRISKSAADEVAAVLDNAASGSPQR